MAIIGKHGGESLESISGRADGLLPEEEQLFKEFQAYVRSITTEITRNTLQVLEQGVQHQIGSVSNTASDVCKQLQKSTEEQVTIIKKTDQHISQTITTLDDTVKRSRDDYKNLFAPAIDSFRKDSQDLLKRFSSEVSTIESEAILKIEQSTTLARNEIREQIKADQALIISEMTSWREQIQTDQALMISKMIKWFVVIFIINIITLAAFVATLIINR